MSYSAFERIQEILHSEGSKSSKSIAVIKTYIFELLFAIVTTPNQIYRPSNVLNYYQFPVLINDREFANTRKRHKTISHSTAGRVV